MSPARLALTRRRPDRHAHGQTDTRTDGPFFSPRTTLSGCWAADWIQSAGQSAKKAHTHTRARARAYTLAYEYTHTDTHTHVHRETSSLSSSRGSRVSKLFGGLIDGVQSSQTNALTLCRPLTRYFSLDTNHKNTKKRTHSNKTSRTCPAHFRK